MWPIPVLSTNPPLLDIRDSIWAGGPRCPRSPHWRFPPRNRIIAGLSAAVVVVEAARIGGALIAAVKATEYAIAVFAMPGDVDRASSEGWTGIYWSAVAAGTFAVGTCLAPKPGIGGPEGRSIGA